jgi:iron complex outermembrane recepter protein
VAGIVLLGLQALTAPQALAHDPAPGEPDDEAEPGELEADALTVVVRAARPEPVTASTTVVTSREIGAFPRRTAEDALRLVPGFSLVQHGSEGKGYQYFVRGFDAIHGADLELTVDGMPVNEWSNIHAQGYLDLGFVLPEVIESVTVTKGPFTLDQGAFAMAGSASYHLGVPEEHRGLRAAYTVGTTNRHRAVATYSPKDGNGHDFVASESLHDDGFGQNRSIDRGTVLGRTRLFDSKRHGTLSVLGSGTVARFGLAGPLRNDDINAGRVGFYDAYDPATRGASVRGQTALTYEHTEDRRALRATLHAGRRRLELLENFTGFSVDPVDGDRRSQQQDTWNFGLDLGYTAPLAEAVDVQLGAGTRGDVFDQHQDRVDGSEIAIERERDLGGLQTLTHARGGVTVQPLETVRLDGGVRMDVAHVRVRDRLAGADGSGTLHAVSPRATAEWEAARALRFFAAYGRGFRPPEARAFSTFLPARVGVAEEQLDDSAPAMTQADAFEIGSRVRASRHLGARLSGFATFIARESLFDHVSGINLELNPTRRVGAEVALHATPLPWLTLSADTTVVDARFVQSGNRIPLAPWLLGSARAIATHDSGLRGGVRFFTVAPRPLPHGATGATLTQLDATAGYHWDIWRLDLEVENLTGRRIREGEFHYASHWRPGEPASRIPALHTFAGPPLNARLTVTAVF